ncbi:MAG: PAS domain S-box protein [Deltaproteobacteria bacterium]|nr:PAS domain S-box protein [Deltaproteobacteria bacterium]
MSFKIRTKLAIAFMSMLFFFLVFTGIIAYYNQQAIYNINKRVEAISDEKEIVDNLRLAMDRILMPGNDYIITGDRGYFDEFKKNSADLEDYLKNMEAALKRLEADGHAASKVKEKREILEYVKTALQNIREISLKIFAIADPVADKNAARLMEEMDYKWSYPAVDRIGKWRKIDSKEQREAIEAAQATWVRSWMIIIAGSIILSAIGLSFAFFYARIFTRPITDIHNGVDKMAAGDLKIRLDIKTGDELQQLSNAMNEMAAQLDGLYSNMQAMVEEKTRGLKESEERYRRLFEGINDAVFVLPLTSDGIPGNFIEVNGVACNRLGYTREELLNMSLQDINAPEMAGNIEAAIKELFVNKQVMIERIHIAKNGRRIPVEINAHLFELKGRQVVLSLARDITERKRREEKIQEQMDYLERFQKASINREFRIKELKDRIKEIEEELKRAKGA